jgi:hypothetical protein
MQHRLRETFGNDIMRTPEEMAMRDGRRDENVGMSSLQGGNLTATTERRGTHEERYREMGKAPMVEGTHENTAPNGRSRDHTIQPTTRYAGTPDRHMRSPLGQPTTTRPENKQQRSTQAAMPWHL